MSSLRAASLGDFVELDRWTTNWSTCERDPVTGWNALLFAIEGGHYDCIALLCERQPELVSAVDYAGFSSLDYACAFNDAIAIAILLEYATPDTVDPRRGECALLRTHRDTDTFDVIQQWKSSHGVPTSPLVAGDGVLRNLSPDRGSTADDQSAIVPVASHVVLPGETVKTLCFSYATTPREIRFLNPDAAVALTNLADSLKPGLVLRVPLRVRARQNKTTLHIALTSPTPGPVVLSEQYRTERRVHHTSELWDTADRDSGWVRDESSTHQTVVVREERNDESKIQTVTRTTAAGDKPPAPASRPPSHTEGANAEETKTTSKKAASSSSKKDESSQEDTKESGSSTTTTTKTKRVTTTTVVSETQDTGPVEERDGDRDSHHDEEDVASSTADAASTVGDSDEQLEAHARDEMAQEDENYEAASAARRKLRAERREAWLIENRRLQSDFEAAQAANDDAALRKCQAEQEAERQRYLSEVAAWEEEDARLADSHDQRMRELQARSEETRRHRAEEAALFDQQRRKRADERNEALRVEIDAARLRGDQEEADALVAERDRLTAADEKDAALRAELRRAQEAEHARRLAATEERRALEVQRRENAAERRRAMESAAEQRDANRFATELQNMKEDESARDEQVRKRFEENQRRSRLHEMRVQKLDADRKRFDDAARERQRAEAAAAAERRRKKDRDVTEALAAARRTGDRHKEVELEEHQRILQEAATRRERRRQEEEALRRRQARALGFEDEDNSAASRKRARARARQQELEAERAALLTEHEAAMEHEVASRRDANERAQMVDALRAERLEHARQRGDKQRELELLAEQEDHSRQRLAREQQEREEDAKRQRDFEAALANMHESRKQDVSEEALLRREKRETKRLKRRVEEQRRQQEARDAHALEQATQLDDARRRGDRIETERLKALIDRQRREQEEEQRRAEELEFERQSRFEMAMTRRRRRVEASVKSEDATARREQSALLKDESQWLHNEESARRRQALRQKQHNDETAASQRDRIARDAERDERDAARQRLIFAARLSRDDAREKRLLEEQRIDRENDERQDRRVAEEARLRSEALAQDLKRLDLEASVAEEKRREAELRRMERINESGRYVDSDAKLDRRRDAADRLAVRNAALEAELEMLAAARQEDEALKQRADSPRSTSTGLTEEQRQAQIEARKQKAIDAAKKRIAERREKEQREREARRKRLQSDTEERKNQKQHAKDQSELAERMKTLREAAKRENSRTPAGRRGATRSPASRSHTPPANHSSAAAQLRILESAEEQRRLSRLAEERERTRHERLVSARMRNSEILRDRQIHAQKSEAETRSLELRARQQTDSYQREMRKDSVQAQLELEADERQRALRERLVKEQACADERRRAAEVALENARKRREEHLRSPIAVTSSPSRTRARPMPVQVRTGEEKRLEDLERLRKRMSFGTVVIEPMAAAGKFTGTYNIGRDWSTCCLVPFTVLPVLHAVDDEPLAAMRGAPSAETSRLPTLLSSTVSHAPSPADPQPEGSLSRPNSLTSALAKTSSFTRVNRSGTRVRSSSFAPPPSTLPKATVASPYAARHVVPGARPAGMSGRAPRNLFAHIGDHDVDSWSSGSVTKLIVIVGDLSGGDDSDVELADIAASMKFLLGLGLSSQSCDVEVFATLRAAAEIAPHCCVPGSRLAVLESLQNASTHCGPVIVAVAAGAAGSPANSAESPNVHLALSASDSISTSEIARVLSHAEGARSGPDAPRLVVIDVLHADRLASGPIILSGSEEGTVAAVVRLHHFPLLRVKGAPVSGALAAVQTVASLLGNAAAAANTIVARGASLSHDVAQVSCVRDCCKQLVLDKASHEPLSGRYSTHVVYGTRSDAVDLMPLLTVGAKGTTVALTGWRALVVRVRVPVTSLRIVADLLREQAAQILSVPSLEGWQVPQVTAAGWDFSLPAWLDEREVAHGVQWCLSASSFDRNVNHSALRDGWAAAAGRARLWREDGGVFCSILEQSVLEAFASNDHEVTTVSSHLLLQNDFIDVDSRPTSEAWVESRSSEALISRCVQDAGAMALWLGSESLFAGDTVSSTMVVPMLLVPPAASLVEPMPTEKMALSQVLTALTQLPLLHNSHVAVSSWDVV